MHCKNSKLKAGIYINYGPQSPELDVKTLSARLLRFFFLIKRLKTKRVPTEDYIIILLLFLTGIAGMVNTASFTQIVQ